MPLAAGQGARSLLKAFFLLSGLDPGSGPATCALRLHPPREESPGTPRQQGSHGADVRATYLIFHIYRDTDVGELSLHTALRGADQSIRWAKFTMNPSGPRTDAMRQMPSY